MAQTKADAAERAALVTHLQHEYASLGDTHPERSAQIVEQLAALGAPLSSDEE